MLTDNSVIKFLAVVSLKSNEWQLELGKYVSMKLEKALGYFRFGT
jgi:hypothetical protein